MNNDQHRALVSPCHTGGTLLLLTRSLGLSDFGIFAGLTALAATIGTLSSFGTHLVLFKSAARTGDQRVETLAYAVPTTLLLGGSLFLLHLFLTDGSCLLPAGGAGGVLLPPLGWREYCRSRVGTEITGVCVLGILAVILAPQLGMKGMAIAAVCMEWCMAFLGIALIARSISRAE